MEASLEVRPVNAPMQELISPVAFWHPEFLVDSAWLGHAPFAFWIMEAIAPRTLVELGTHHGYSYNAFCQAVATLNLDTKTFAVDTWEGDEHAGFYGPEILRTLREHQNPRYEGFSELWQMRFDEAADKVPDKSIDLLHIDGRHFEEDVWEDFRVFESKLSSRAVVLFHDTQVQERGFGVYKVWAELEKLYPSFEFHHSYGLGVLAVGAEVPPHLARFLEHVQHPTNAVTVRNMYSQLGRALVETFEHQRELDQLGQTQAALDESESKRRQDLALLEERENRIAAMWSDIAAYEESVRSLQQTLKAANARNSKLASQLASAKQQLNALRNSRTVRTVRTVKSLLSISK